MPIWIILPLWILFVVGVFAASAWLVSHWWVQRKEARPKGFDVLPPGDDGRE